LCILQLDNNRANVSELKQYESKVEEEAYEEAEEEEEEDEVQVQVSLKLCSGRVACEREEREGGWRRLGLTGVFVTVTLSFSYL